MPPTPQPPGRILGRALLRGGLQAAPASHPVLHVGPPPLLHVPLLLPRGRLLGLLRPATGAVLPVGVVAALNNRGGRGVRRRGRGVRGRDQRVGGRGWRGGWVRGSVRGCCGGRGRGGLGPAVVRLLGCLSQAAAEAPSVFNNPMSKLAGPAHTVSEADPADVHAVVRARLGGSLCRRGCLHPRRRGRCGGGPCFAPRRGRGQTHTRGLRRSVGRLGVATLAVPKILPGEVHAVRGARAAGSAGLR
mmetsp:Transcript_24663/g.59835  ORF Transcript_24663/g.59835 Transcript_24663/m.59835 type:complete len:246 (+) Transcript_24663:110-847(+)